MIDTQNMGIATFYTTSGCHLCEEAKELLIPLLIGSNWRLQEVDIADDDNLMARYGIRIPVLSVPSVGELDWPFTIDEVARSLSCAI